MCRNQPITLYLQVLNKIKSTVDSDESKSFSRLLATNSKHQIECEGTLVKLGLKEKNHHQSKIGLLFRRPTFEATFNVTELYLNRSTESGAQPCFSKISKKDEQYKSNFPFPIYPM